MLESFLFLETKQTEGIDMEPDIKILSSEYLLGYKGFIICFEIDEKKNSTKLLKVIELIRNVE